MTEGIAALPLKDAYLASGSNDRKLGNSQSQQLPNQSPLCCPECGAGPMRLYKDGLCRTISGEVQRYLCRDCGYRFSHSSSTRDNLKPLNLPSVHTNTRQVCDDHERAPGTRLVQELAIVEPGKVAQREGTSATPDEATTKGLLVEFMFYLQKQGYDELTRKKRYYKLRRLTQLGADLKDPESVKEVLGKQASWLDAYKRQICYAYENFLAMKGMKWERPIYKASDRQIPFIPTEAELDQLINGSGKRIGTFLQGLKDTGCDPMELASISWTDVNPERKTVNINHPVKGHNTRVLKVSREFINRLESLSKRSERIFSLPMMNGLFYHQRRNIARKLANPRLSKIMLTTFRDWRLTMIARRTGDAFQVMAVSGHKSMDSIMFYVNLAEAIYGKGEYDQYTVRVANNVGEAAKLIENGFEYVTGEYEDGGKIFKKPKTEEYVEFSSLLPGAVTSSTPLNNVERAGSSAV